MKKPLTPLRLIRAAGSALAGIATAPEKWAYQRGLLSIRELSFPDFLGIGAQKAGSSWLYENLRAHPDLYLPGQKELHFWDRRYHRSLRFYCRRFKEGGARLKGEITPAYSCLPLSRIRLLAAIRPDLKVILLVRNPVERAWSHALMDLVKRGRPFPEVPTEAFMAHFRSFDSWKHADYRGILRRWQTCFPRVQIFVGFFEDVVSNPQPLLEEIFSFLGVGAAVDWDRMPYRSPVNAGPGLRMPADYRAFLEGLWRDEIEEQACYLGGPAERWRVAALPDAVSRETGLAVTPPQR